MQKIVQDSEMADASAEISLHKKSCDHCIPRYYTPFPIKYSYLTRNLTIKSQKIIAENRKMKGMF